MPNSSPLAPPLVPIVVMGVSGCGKTTIGGMLAEHLGVPYAEADQFHPRANVEKMARGIALTDQDREPWLAAIADRIAAHAGAGIVVSCSALKRRYRDVLRRADPQAWFVHLVVDPAAAAVRVAGRATHFMPTTLVDSQFEALEPLQAEPGIAVDASQSPQQIIATVLNELVARSRPATAVRESGPRGRCR